METYHDLTTLADHFGTPFYVFDQERFEANFRDLDEAFRTCWPKLVIGYSYKTNYLPYLCRLVRDLGGHAEVVSGLEYELALRIGQDPREIIFNGPLKTYAEMERALDLGSRVNLDSWYELEHLQRYLARYPEPAVGVGLRINLDLTDAEGRCHIQNGLSVGRFGFAPEDLPEVLRRLDDCGQVRITGLHGHASSSSRSTWVFEHITRTLCDLAAKHRLDDLEYLDIGGGMFGPVPEQMRRGAVPTFADYARAVGAVLGEHPWSRIHQPLLILEPGVALVADSLRLATRVVDLKSIRGTRFAVVDGSVLHIKSGMQGMNQPCRLVSPQPGAEEVLYQVVGSTCMEKDYLLRDAVLPELARGDFLVIDQAGAYSMVMSPPFIHPAPPILVRDRGGYRPLRFRQSFEAFFAGFTMPQERQMQLVARSS